MTKESRCFMLLDSTSRREAPSHNIAICGPCRKRVTGAQRAIATSKRFHAATTSDDCDICAMKALKPESFTTPFCNFLTENPTIFHAVGYFKEKLNAAGFEEVFSRPISEEIILQ